MSGIRNLELAATGCFSPEILVIPGGGSHRPGAPAVAESLQLSQRERQVLAELATGASNKEIEDVRHVILDRPFRAYAELPHELTTNSGSFETLAKAAPNANIVRKRFTDNGKYVIGAGLSSGFAALHVVEKRFGRATAMLVARSLEYDWDPESRYAAGELADGPAIEAMIATVRKGVTPLHYRADQNGSQIRFRVGGKAEQVKAMLGEYFKNRGWTADAMKFSRVDASGAKWVCLAELREEQPNATIASLTVTRSKAGN